MIKKLFNHVYQDHLYRNSIYLILNSFVMGFFGFFFWIISARIFSTEQVGLASTMISVMSLLISLSLLGFNVALIRYLPKSERRDEKINSTFILSSLMAVIVSIIFVFGINLFSPKLSFIKENKVYLTLFIFFIVFGTLFTLIESVFIASRNSKLVLFKNSFWSALKVGLLFLFVTWGSFGIFSSWVIAMAIAFSFSLLFVKINFKFKVNKKIVKNMFKFSAGNYVASFLATAPAMILPIMVTNLIGPEQTAYFYIAWMIAGLLFIVPSAVSRSLLTECSHGEMGDKLKNAFKIIFSLLFIGIILVFFLGKLMLSLFSGVYAQEAFIPLLILALSSLPYAVNVIYITLENVKKNVRKVVLWYGLIALVTLISSYMLLGYGLLGISLGWLIGNLVGVVVVFFSKKEQID